MPERLQLSRRKGFRLPQATVNVARPSVFGNPFRVEEHGRVTAVHLYDDWLSGKITGPHSPSAVLSKLEELRGKNLACFCPLDRPCHADVLLRLANASPAEPSKAEAYLDFLRAKMPVAQVAGFEPPSPPHPSLKPHQVDIATWSCRGGRRAGFAAFGLGKTRIQIQIAQWTVEKTDGRFLIIAPLGVRQEFTQSDGPAMGAEIVFVRDQADIDATDCRILITNYESVRLGKIDVTQFAGVSLDEASCLRSYGSKTFQTFLTIFKAVPYRWVFTATPSPNRYKELIHYGGYLGVMDTGEALTRFFRRDPKKAGNLTLHPHMESQFWHWLASWACFIQRPSDLGHDDTGYDLPGLHVHWHRLEVDHTEAWGQEDDRGQKQLLASRVTALPESAATKRRSIGMRVAFAKDIIAHEPVGKHWLIWHDLEDERREIEKEMPLATTVYGTQDENDREDLIMGFSRGDYRILATKPVIAGSGCNFQRHCADAVFLGVNYRFNDFIQAIHRIYRFQQTREVHIHIIHLASEDEIVSELKAKWRRHEVLMETMTRLLQQYRLSTSAPMDLTRTLIDGAEVAEATGTRFRLIHNDCTLEAQKMPENSVHGIVTSIPFGNQYEYSPTFNDFGHNPGDAGFFEQMGFLCPELLRVTMPGRIAAIHVKDRIEFGNVTGHGCPTVNPFSDKTVQAFKAAGWLFLARITIDTDVVRENAQTYRLSWTENAKDGTKMGAGMPEYVLIFRKPPTDNSNAYADEPVTKSKEEYTRADWQMDAAGLWRSNGNRLPDPEILAHLPLGNLKRMWERYATEGGYSYEEHVALAKSLEEKGKLPGSWMLFPPVSRKADIWTDVLRINTLNSEQSRRNQENHLCPLQLDIIKRLIHRYTNKDEVVLDPFAGIGSVPYQAVTMGRIGWGIELNADYWKCAVHYCERAEAELEVPTLFDLDFTEAPTGGKAA